MPQETQTFITDKTAVLYSSMTKQLCLVSSAAYNVFSAIEQAYPDSLAFHHIQAVLKNDDVQDVGDILERLEKAGLIEVLE